MDDAFSGALFLFSLAVFLIIGIGAIIAPNTTLERSALMADTMCTDSGYQVHIEDNRVWYCVSYGLEPKIERLGTVIELDKLYGETNDES